MGMWAWDSMLESRSASLVHHRVLAYLGLAEVAELVVYEFALAEV